MRFLWSRPQFLWTAASSVLASKMVGLGTGPTTLSTTLPTPLIRRRIDPEIAGAAPLLMQPRAFFALPTHDVALLGVNWFHQVRTVAAITTEAQESGWRVVVPLLHESPPALAAPAAVVPGPLTHQTRHARDARPTYERMCASEEHVARQVVDAMRTAGPAPPILALVPPVFLYADSLPWRIRRLAKNARVTTLSIEPADDEDDNEDDRPMTTFFSPQGEYVIHTFASQGRTS